MTKTLICLTIIALGFFVLHVSFAASGSEVKKQDSGVGDKLEAAIFAGGCFWCMEQPFEELAGVREVISGYTAGRTENPSYQNYEAGGHIEVVKIIFDPAEVSYATLLEVFWMQINPVDAGGQFVDRGRAYSTAIFYANNSQKVRAERSKAALEARSIYPEPIVTPVLPVETFYPAEDYHQDYYKKNPLRYKYYRNGSGRDKYLDSIWGEKRKYWSEKELRKRLTPIQYEVTQKDGTEPAFSNEYWDNKRDGIYVDIVSGAPLFSSLDKYNSGTGWPSFTRPLVLGNIITRKDRTLFLSVRIEVRSKMADSHLGHIFDDGPPPTGKRYCINSAALRFVPVEDLKAAGYGQFLPLWD